MLHIILIILKIIGITLLAILGIFVVLICLAVFTPFKYQGELSAKGTVASIEGTAKFSWFFHLIRGQFQYKNQNFKWNISVLWKKYPAVTSKPNAASKKTEIKEKVKKTELEEETENVKTEEEAEKAAVIEIEESSVPKREKKGKKEKPSIIKKIKSTIRSICDRMKMLRDKKEELELFVNDEIHRAAFGKLKAEIFRFIGKLKPKRFYMRFHFGFEDPSLTGKVLGLLCMLYPIFEDNINIEPDFQNAILEGELFIKGKLRCSHPLGMGIRLLLDGNVRKTFMELISEKAKKQTEKQEEL